MTILLRNRSRRARPGALRQRAGLSVIEIVVALTLFGTVTIAMSGLSFVIAKRAEANDVITKRTALLQQQMNFLQAIPYDSLTSKAGGFEEVEGSFPHRRKIVVSPTANGSRSRVTITVIPDRAPDHIETISFDRARPTTSPLCKEC